MLYRFADCALDTQLYTLHRAGQSTRLPPKVFEVLCYLIEHRDRVVSKQELCEQVWAGIAITDATLESCLRVVRTTVGDSGQAQRIIQTQRGYGYRFVADLAQQPEDTSPLPVPLKSALPVVVPGVRPCAACHYTNPEDAAFCAACGTRLRQPCAHCGQAILLPSAFCPACGQPLVVPSSPAPDASPVAVSAPSQTVVTPPDQRGFGAERKLVTVLCCTVASTAAGGTRLNLDTLYSVIQELHGLALDVVRPYGGRLSPTMGDRLLILFGVPTAHEDDARRAVRVALELQRRFQMHQERLEAVCRAPLAFCLGLHTGLAVVGGTPDDAELATVVGDVVSVAMLLLEQAAPGELLCSDTTARLIQGLARLKVLAPVPLPGQPTPMMTYAILGGPDRRAPGWERWERVLSPFVGRERELATLHALLAQVATGRGQVVGVVGEPGMGKSRLIYEFRQSLAGKRLIYLAGRCLSYGSTTPYLPVLDILRHNCGITETDRSEAITAKVHRALQEVAMAPDEWASVLLHLLGVQDETDTLTALDPATRKARTLMAVTQLCLNGSRLQPLILELEDLHWIDASSDECLMALVERMAGAALLVLVTYRPGYRPPWVDKSYATQMALQPLPSQDSLQVVQAVLPTAAQTAPLVPQLLAQAEGNPFFLEELARAVAEQGANATSLTVPTTIQAVLMARIDRLPATAKRLLQAAAVMGKEVALPLLQAVTAVPEESMHDALRSLQTAEFLYETYTLTAPVYTFTHVLTQEVAYQSLVRRERQRYHAHIAQVLEAQFPEVAESQPELLAYHYTEADRGAQAIPYWQHAGQRAVERSANVEAISHFTTGLELLKTLPETSGRLQQELRLHLALGSPLMIIKGQAAPEVEQLYSRALELSRHLEDHTHHFAALKGLIRFHNSAGRFRTACAVAEQGLALAQRVHDPALRWEAHLELGATLFYLGELVSARLHLEQGLALYAPEQSHFHVFSSGTHPQPFGLSSAAWTLWLLGYPDRALTRSQEALALAQQLSYPYSVARALYYAASLHQCRREAPCVQQGAEALMALSHEHGFRRWLGRGMVMRGWALVEQGAAEEGIAQLHQGLAVCGTMVDEVGRPVFLTSLAQAYGKVAQPEVGLRQLAEALEVSYQTGELRWEAESYRLKGELLLLTTGSGPDASGCTPHPPRSTSPLAEAEACFQQALAVARRQQAKSLELRAATSLARLWQQQGKRAEAYELLAPIYGWFTEGFDTADLQEAKALLEALA
jgi:class 3 adenylate cyclase/DNA-binding winged helix-turn-helix (wHTH) protein/predicted ATPase